MHPLPSNGRTARILCALYLTWTALFALRRAVTLTHHADSFQIGDWLINYSGGFVRRGLLGSPLLYLAHATHLPLLWLTLALQVAIFLAFYLCLYQLLRRTFWNLPLLALFLSPATLAFIPLNPLMGFRKEILLLALLTAIVLPSFQKLPPGLQSPLLAIAAAALVLAHEGLFLYLPYLGAAIYLQQHNFRRSLRIVAAPLAAALIAMLAILLHPATPQATAAACRAIGGTPTPFAAPSAPGICGGSIEWLPLTPTQAHAIAWSTFTAHAVLLYACLLPLALAPALWALLVLYRQPPRRVAAIAITACALASMLATTLLLYASIDWGRWIALHAACLLVLLLAEAQPSHLPIPSPPPRRLTPLTALALLLFATCWTLPFIAVSLKPLYLTGYYGSYRLFYRPIHRPPPPTPNYHQQHTLN